MNLISRTICQSDVYQTDHSRYVYKVTWTEYSGYTLQRRKAPDIGIMPSHFWDRGVDVENWIQLDGGMFDPSIHARPVVKFVDFQDVKEVIESDIIKSRFD